MPKDTDECIGMFVPEMAYSPVTLCQGFGAEFSRLNSEENTFRL